MDLTVDGELDLPLQHDHGLAASRLVDRRIAFTAGRGPGLEPVDRDVAALSRQRRRQLLDLVAAADADADGVITQVELAALDITTQARYQVGSRDITDLWGYISAQTATVGHIDGEGHCE